ncbi:MAG: hypothetical protein QXZ47_02265 [Candidatus Bathyarchaeia archaeon]
MKGLVKQKRGQFVLIATLMIAIMIISIAALLHTAATYYKHEPWDEYLTLIGDIELNSRRLVEISLANFTNTLNPNILKINMEKWQTDVSKIYSGRGISLNYTLANGLYKSVNYFLGLNRSWEKRTSFSAANVTFTLNISSIGLSGYKFTTVTFLSLKILNVDFTNKEITITVKGEDNKPVTSLKNIEVANATVKSVSKSYDAQETLIYIIAYDGNIVQPVKVTVTDLRDIKVIAKY